MPVAIRPALVLDYTMTGTLTQNVDYTATRPFVVADYHAVVLAQDANSSIGLQRGSPGFVAILTAMVTNASLVGDVVRVALGFTSAQYVVAAAEVIRAVFTSGNNTLSARAYALVLPTVITGTAPGFTGVANNATNLT